MHDNNNYYNKYNKIINHLCHSQDWGGSIIRMLIKSARNLRGEKLARVRIILSEKWLFFWARLFCLQLLFLIGDKIVEIFYSLQPLYWQSSMLFLGMYNSSKLGKIIVSKNLDTLKFRFGLFFFSLDILLFFYFTLFTKLEKSAFSLANGLQWSF